MHSLTLAGSLSSRNPPPPPPPPPPSYCEVYNEEVTDLLAAAGAAKPQGGLAVREGDAHRGVYVEGLTEHVAVNGGRGGLAAGWLGVGLGWTCVKFGVAVPEWGRCG